MTFSILWVVLAATVIVVASMRRSGVSQDQGGGLQVRQPGRALTAVGIVYSLVLLAGFLYIGWQHSIELMK
jgi:heme/copper-type cytochrome/quinol oxidase subunit 2